MSKSISSPFAVFVLGSPRSGTTLMGALIGSCSNVADLGEYGGFYLSHAVAHEELGTMPTPYLADYLSSLREHSEVFAQSVALAGNASCYVDSTPWNLLVAHELARQLPDAVFVLMLRHYGGVVQSLARSDVSKHSWAGRNWRERAAVWRNVYQHALDLPMDRTIPVGYEALCREPAGTIGTLKNALRARGVMADTMDLGMLAISHATDPRHARPVIGRRSGDGAVAVRPIRTWDPSGWSRSIRQEVEEEVADVDAMLRSRFPSAYWTPSGGEASFFRSREGALHGSR
ncbi:hypothetical protein GCM10022226_43860 [Sphaerisporangium flaviroseum]|uniref:Sulfotransferase family protein n=1 Tax=Sphaerisporangium flaviroseum TaxID=509199 RepID=A0ABP7IHJ0_9ACTN